MDETSRNEVGYTCREPTEPLERAFFEELYRLVSRNDVLPVGIITMRNRIRSPACEQMIDCRHSTATVIGAAGGGARAGR